MDFDDSMLTDLNYSLKNQVWAAVIELIISGLILAVLSFLENRSFSDRGSSGCNEALCEQNNALNKIKEQITKKMDDLYSQAKKEREGYSKYPVFLPPDGKETHCLDIDYWTRGRVSEIYAQLPDPDDVRNGSLNQLTKDEISKMLELIKEVNKNMEGELEKISAEAGFNYVCSRGRRDVGRLIQQQLTGFRGWSLKKGMDQGFIDRDPRNEIQFELVNPAGDQMTVNVSSIQNSLKPEVYVSYSTVKPVSKDYQDALRHTMESVFQKSGIPMDSFIFG